MVVFDNLEEIFQQWRDFSEYSKALVTLATVTGTLFVTFYTLRLVCTTYKGLKLYLCSQLCCKANFRERYGQWAVISGATDGIGLAMAKELARRGMSIIVIGRNDEKLAQTQASLKQEPNVGEVETVKIDLSDSSLENYEKIRSQIDPENRDIGVLINNAGVMSYTMTRFYNFNMNDLKTQVNVNILATLYFTRMILPGMVNRKRGLILNVSSTLGSVAGPFYGVYGPTKTFVNAFSRQLQVEYAGYPVDIINLTPGAVHTKLLTGTSTLTKPSVMNPTPEDYARTALNATSTRYPSFAGTWFHGISMYIFHFFDSVGVLPYIFRVGSKMHARDARLSPSPTRKANIPATGDN